ncbi:MAG: FUSC family protein [Blautia sp.]|nr:FUSC family protein [Blautia sp.]
MTFYQELQLSSTGSKQLIRNTTDKKEKRRHILIYNFKVYLVMAFCVAVVTLYSKITGNDNSVVGVTVLLAMLVLRQADFGIRTTHGLLSIAGIFGILIAGPRLSNMVSPIPAFLINAVSILLLMILGCHNVIMYNHSTFVLGYLLLMGYDVTGKAYVLRVQGLLVGMVLCMVIFYKNQKKRPYRRTFPDLFREFDLCSSRGRWYLRLTLIVSSAMLIMSLLGLPRAMWAGIACMSVCLPFTEDCKTRAGKRGMFNIVGCLLFVVLYLVLPKSMYPYIGMIGGIGVGYSAGYAWQTAFNTFGALSIAAGLFGMPAAVLLRIGANVFGAAYTMLLNKLGDKIVQQKHVVNVSQM